MVLLDVVREFVALSSMGDVSGSDLARAKLLMAQLRRAGFKGGEISALSGGVWKASSVRVYTGEWGEVDQVLYKQRDELMGSLRKLASSKNTIGDVEWFIAVDASIKLKGSTPADVAELNTNMGLLGLKPGDVGQMLEVSRQVKEEPGGIAGVRERIKLDGELGEVGITQKVMLDLQEKCKQYGGLSGVLSGLKAYPELQDLEKKVEETQKRLSNAEGKLEDAKALLDENKDILESLEFIYRLGWTPMSLMAFPGWLRKSDTPESIREALAGTRSLQDLFASKKRAQDDYDRVRMQLEEANATLKDKNGIIHSIDFLHANGWDDVALMNAPNLLKRGGTPEKYAILLKGINSLDEAYAEAKLVIDGVNAVANKVNAEIDGYKKILKEFKEDEGMAYVQTLYGSRSEVKAIVDFYIESTDTADRSEELARIINKLFVKFWTMIERDPNALEPLRKQSIELAPILGKIDPTRPFFKLEG